MLKFTPEQEAAINAARSQFNCNQEALAPTIQLVGNAAPVPLDAWRRVDTRASMIQRNVLSVFNALAAANTTPLALGDLVKVAYRDYAADHKITGAMISVDEKGEQIEVESEVYA